MLRTVFSNETEKSYCYNNIIFCLQEDTDLEKFKNINSIEEVKGVLEKFQQAYDRKATNQVDTFVEEMFSSKEGLVVIGSGMEQWAFNLEDTKKLIAKHWREDNQYFKNLDFQFGKAYIFATEDTAWVVSIGNSSDFIPEEKKLKEAEAKVKEILNREEKSQKNALSGAFNIAKTLLEVELGEEYKWIFRFTALLIKEKASWKFHQMQFSMDANEIENFCREDNFDESYLTMPEPVKNEDTEQVRKVLEVFQEGYTKRDVAYVEEYLKKVFLGDEQQIVIGTDAGELCFGIDRIRGIVTSDWKYWGDFSMNVEEAHIAVNGETAYFSTKAILKRLVTKEQILNWISGISNYTLSKEEKPIKHRLMEVLCTVIDLLSDGENEGLCILPMRFSGVLVKQDGRWLIHHAQYSDYVDKYPGTRTL